MRGAVGRGRLGAIVVVALLAGALTVAAAGPAAAQTQTKTYPQVNCTAVVNGTTISQKQDITVSISAPDSVAPGSSFTITFPGGTAFLPTQSNGFTITSYSNIFLTYQIHNATFTSGTIVNPGTATLIPAGSSTPQTIVEASSLPAPDQIKSGQPGPFNPGQGGNNQATLITPDISVNAVAPASGSVTLNALTLTTTVKLNGQFTANVTCNIPQDTIITIPVGAGNTPPTVNAGPDVSGNSGAAIALSGSVSDPDDTPTDSWTINDPACTFANPSAPATTVTCSKGGTFTATLTADDGANPPVSDTAQVSVTQTVPIVVSAGGAVSGAVAHQIALHGSVSDPGHTPTSAWTVNSPNCTFANAAAPDTTISCSTTGTFTATLSAQDGVNPPASDTATVTVTTDAAPTVSAGADVSGDTGAPIALSGVVTDPDDTPTVHWTASDPGCTFANAAQAATSITCSAPGTYTATLTANDGYNPAVSDTTSVVATDVMFPFNYVVDAVTHLNTLNQDVTIPTGTFTGVIDLTTGALTGDITLPPADFTFTLAGVGAVTAHMQITETQPITGHVDTATLAVTATAVFDIKIVSLHPTASPTTNLVGDSCKTSTPASVTMTGPANLAGASTFSGTYTIPPFANCGAFTNALNAAIAGPGNTFTAVVQPPPAPPTIDSQPGDTTVAPGQTYSFDAAASGYPAPTVQWQLSTNGGSSFTDIGGANGSSYSATAALSDSGKKFRAVFTNASGTVNSAVATLTVAVVPDPPTIGTATAGPSSASVAFTGPANNGGSPVIDYTASCTTSAPGVNGSATGNASPLTVSGLTPGAIYTCAATARNAIGSSAPSGASNQVVPTAPPTITTQPANANVAPGQTYSFTAAASGSPGPTAQWQVSTNGGSSFTNIGGATSPTYSATAALADSGKQFRAVFTNSTGTATTNAATLTVTAVAPQITSQPANQSVNTGATYTFSASASGAPAPTVQWQVSVGGGAFSNVTGATSDTLTGTAASSDSGKQFRAVYTNAAGTATTTAATLTVVSITTISIGNATVVEGVGGAKNHTGTLAVTLSQTSSQNVTVHYATSSGTALAGADYAAKSGNLTFKPGKTTLYVAVAVKPDAIAESDETVQVTLSSPGGGYSLSATHNVGTLTIVNDAAGTASQVSVGDATIYRAVNGPAEVAKVLVSLSNPAASSVTVHLTLSAGTATSGGDYKPWAAKTLTFAAGTFQKVIAVSVFPGSSAQANKTAILTLSNPSSGTTIARTTGTLTISNHD
jgi:hypothetical protein